MLDLDQHTDNLGTTPTRGYQTHLREPKRQKDRTTFVLPYFIQHGLSLSTCTKKESACNTTRTLNKQSHTLTHLSRLAQNLLTVGAENAAERAAAQQTPRIPSKAAFVMAQSVDLVCWTVTFKEALAVHRSNIPLL